MPIALVCGSLKFLWSLAYHTLQFGRDKELEIIRNVSKCYFLYHSKSTISDHFGSSQCVYELLATLFRDQGIHYTICHRIQRQ